LPTQPGKGLRVHSPFDYPGFPSMGRGQQQIMLLPGLLPIQLARYHTPAAVWSINSSHSYPNCVMDGSLGLHYALGTSFCWSIFEGELKEQERVLFLKASQSYVAWAFKGGACGKHYVCCCLYLRQGWRAIGHNLTTTYTASAPISFQYP
jgi:hypothetical protein